MIALFLIFVKSVAVVVLLLLCSCCASTKNTGSSACITIIEEINKISETG